MSAHDFLFKRVIEYVGPSISVALHFWRCLCSRPFVPFGESFVDAEPALC